MCMQPTCTVSTILLWVRQKINRRRSWYHMPPSRWSIQANTLSDTWLSSISSDFQTHMNNTPSSVYDWQKDDYTIPSSTPTRTWPITSSVSVNVHTFNEMCNWSFITRGVQKDVMNIFYLLSYSSPRWDNLPSGHQRYPLFGLNLGYMYWGQKRFSDQLKHTNTCRRKWCMYWWGFFWFKGKK